MRQCSTRSTCSATFCHQLVTSKSVCRKISRTDALSVLVAVSAEVRQKEAELAAAKGSFEKDKARHQSALNGLSSLKSIG